LRVSVADVSAAAIAEGRLYDLVTPADLSGNYSAVTANLTIIACAGLRPAIALR
jgi:hypothetical protein